MKRQQFVYRPAMVRDSCRHGRRRLPWLRQTRMRRAKVIDRAHQEHPLVQRQGVAGQRPATTRQRREALPECRVQPVTVDGGIIPPTSASSRVEGRRAGCRWRVSSPALSIAGWVHNSAMATFPAPATSNAACGFPALRFPARFMSRVMGPILLGALSAVDVAPGSC
jgi:hypothetical protein